MRFIDVPFTLLLPAVVIFDLVVAPYTKVEESFNIQAAHDILVYGTPTSNINQKLSTSYDHFSFPGAVPRTFIGPVLLAGVSQPLVALVGFDHAQLVVRAVLGLFNAFALVFFKSQVAGAWGPSAARWYAMLQASQFHVMFYASRTLPNMFAFGLTTIAFGLLLPSTNVQRSNARVRLAVALFVLSAVIFRSEIAILLATNALYLLIIPLISLDRLIPAFLVAFIASICISVPVDSYFWQKPIWPELWGFYYNVVQGSSSNWGTSPWYYYFVSALPRLLLNPLAPILIAIPLRSPVYSRLANRFVIPNLLFVAIYSLQPHKEARFIFYVVPPLTAVAGLGASIITTRHTKSASPLWTLASWAVVASIPLSQAISATMLLLSSLNYPGGEALAALQAIVRADEHLPAAAGAVVPVHADVLACMTGVTLFGAAAAAGGSRFPSRKVTMDSGDGMVVGRIAGGGDAAALVLVLDKTEDEATLRDPRFWTRFDYLLVEDAGKVVGGQWDTVAVVDGFAGVEILRPGAERASSSGEERVRRVGKGAILASWRDAVRRYTGGYWAGPRLEPKIRILKRVKDSERSTEVTS